MALLLADDFAGDGPVDGRAVPTSNIGAIAWSDPNSGYSTLDGVAKSIYFSNEESNFGMQLGLSGDTYGTFEVTANFEFLDSFGTESITIEVLSNVLEGAAAYVALFRDSVVFYTYANDQDGFSGSITLSGTHEVKLSMNDGTQILYLDDVIIATLTTSFEPLPLDVSRVDVKLYSSDSTTSGVMNSFQLDGTPDGPEEPVVVPDFWTDFRGSHEVP
jgi:hypothetical protein